VKLKMQPLTEKLEGLRILFEACRFSTNTENALIRHLIGAASIESVCWEFSIKQPNFSRSLSSLSTLNDIVERKKEHDLYHIKDMNLTVTNEARV
jgi:hypothetical protein